MKYPSHESIRKARSNAGLTQREAANLIGYSRRSWQEWESGRRNMRWIAFDKFVKLTGGRSGNGIVASDF